MKTGSTVSVMSALLALSQTSSLAISFTPVTNNNPADAATSGQYSVNAEAGPAAGTIQFTFNNAGPAASSITDIYFDDGALDGGLLLDMLNITGSAGVQFSEGASPPNLPGGNTIDFDAIFSADSDSPTAPNGINPGEWLTIVFSLEAGIPLADALDAYNSAEHQIGIHVQAFAGGGSESFVTTGNGPDPRSVVPDGGTTAALLGLGIAGLALARRKLS